MDRLNIKIDGAKISRVRIAEVYAHYVIVYLYSTRAAKPVTKFSGRDLLKFDSLD